MMMLVLPNFKGQGSGVFCTNPFMEKRVAALGFVGSHPSRKNKDAARVGHPGFVVERASGGWGFVVSHPTRDETARWMGHGGFVGER